jgi:hypothetical protein
MRSTFRLFLVKAQRFAVVWLLFCVIAGGLLMLSGIPGLQAVGAVLIGSGFAAVFFAASPSAEKDNGRSSTAKPSPEIPRSGMTGRRPDHDGASSDAGRGGEK